MQRSTFLSYIYRKSPGTSTDQEEEETEDKPASDTYENEEFCAEATDEDQDEEDGREEEEDVSF